MQSKKGQKRELERIDIEFTRTLKSARKKVEGRRKGAPCSREKLLCWSKLAYWKLRKKQAMGIITNEESMESKKNITIIIDNTNTTEEIEAEL